jgi:hypothetical protein
MSVRIGILSAVVIGRLIGVDNLLFSPPGLTSPRAMCDASKIKNYIYLITYFIPFVIATGDEIVGFCFEPVFSIIGSVIDTGER